MPGVERMQGPHWKQGYFGIPRRTMGEIEGEVNHSAEGPMGALLGAIMHATRQASWTFSIGQDGRIVQHYPFESITWHCGTKGDLDTSTVTKGNVALLGKEHAGVAGQPIVGAQEDASVRITNFVREHSLAGAKPPAKRVNLFEHNWVTPNTACPSGRVNWARYINKIAKEEDMLNAEDKTWISTETWRIVLQLLRLGTTGDKNQAMKGWSDDLIARLTRIEAGMGGGDGGGYAGITDEELAKIAEAVNDETARRLK